MRRKDYIPESDMDFSVWADNFIKRLDDDREHFGFPAEVYDRLKQLHAEFARQNRVLRPSLVEHAQ
jgi:hypothetical protein